MDNASKLLELAKKKFGTLTKADQKLFKGVANGEIANYSVKEEKDNDPAKAENWGSKRVLKADRLAWLCTDKQAEKLVTHRGIRIKGARIEEKLDLEYGESLFPLIFEKCNFPQGMNLRDAKIRELNLDGTHTGPIDGDGLTVDGCLFLSEGFEAQGEVRLIGATIRGDLDCEKARFINPKADVLSGRGLKVEGCVYMRNGFKAEGEVCMAGAIIGENFDCSGGHFINKKGKTAFDADGLNIKGNVFFRDGFKAFGAVRLVGAKIGGNLECNNAKFFNRHGSSLNGERLDVKGDVFLCRGTWSENDIVDSKQSKFKSRGEVNLVCAKIGGTLECRGGLFSNPGKHALHGGRLEVGRNVYLRNGFRAYGEIGLVDATIKGNLECNNATFINNKKVKDTESIALNGERLTVKGDVFLCKGHWGNEPAAEIERFRAEGEIRLVSAQISGTLQCKGGELLNPNKRSLQGRGLKVEGDVFLNKGFRAEGEVCLVSAEIGRNLDCKKGSFIHEKGEALLANSMNVKGNVFLCDGFKAKGKVSLVSAKIDGFFYWMNVQSPEEVRLDLRSARIGTLRDEEKSWPTKNRLFLHGLVYDEIHNKAPRKAESRIDWLQRQGSFWPQPYEQLTAVFRKSGEDAKVKKILIAKNKDKARLSQLTLPEKIWYCCLGPIIGYGYSPLNALQWILVPIVLGWVFYGIGYNKGLITPSKESAFVESDTKIVIPGDDKRNLSDVYPRFNVWVYSIDVFVPLIDLHQASYWLPNMNNKAELSILNIFHLPISGSILHCFFWLQIIVGWVLSTLLVVGATGLVRK